MNETSVQHKSASCWFLVVLVIFLGCQGTTGAWLTSAEGEMGPAVKNGIVIEPWGEIDGKAVHRYTLDNGRMRIRISDYGATVTECLIPGNNGKFTDVVLGFDSVEDYIERSPYFGCIVGRCANRIAGGRFTLDGTEQVLATNNGEHHLHGGENGFDKKIWEAKPISTDDGMGVEMVLTSASGEEGYPGEVQAAVRYILTTEDTLRVEMAASSDRATPVNLAHHSYWNLAGHDSGTVLDQELTLACSRYTPAQNLIPTGEIAAVSGTPLDFTTGKKIGASIDQLPGDGEGDPGGFDHNFVIDGNPGTLRFAARAIDPASGTTMEVWTDQPGIQFYSGNFLDGVAGKNGAMYHKHGGFCLESQIWPDAINKQDNDSWPSVVLRPGEIYTHIMEHRFDLGGGA
ncbi:MAG: aldose epimerase family protein [Planctomycetota bacterium]|nr:aldose epimerase family protein [Planctomycetota bacterium]